MSRFLYSLDPPKWVGYHYFNSFLFCLVYHLGDEVSSLW